MSHCNSEKISQTSDRSSKTQKILDTIDKAYKQLRNQQKVGVPNFIHRISLNLEQDKVQQMLTNLTNGYIVMKHSQGTKEPHQKFLYLSQDRRFLCWKSLDKQDQKMIELRKIEFVAMNKQLVSFRKSATMTNERGSCFIILSDIRTLQIQCRNEDEADKIIGELQQAMKNSRRMHLSYRF